MGFWNALSVLAPVAPALSDAQDIRTARQQDTAKFAQDQQLHDAQMTTQKMAAQEAQQRIRAGNQPIPRGDPYWEGTKMVQSVLDPEKGFTTIDATWAESPQQKVKKFADEYQQVYGKPMPDDTQRQVIAQAYGFPLPKATFKQYEGDAGKPRKDPSNGHFYVYGMDENGAQTRQDLGTTASKSNTELGADEAAQLNKLYKSDPKTPYFTEGMPRADANTVRSSIQQTQAMSNSDKRLAIEDRRLEQALQNSPNGPVAGNPNFAGDAYLATLPGSERSLVQGVGTGKIGVDRLSYILARNPRLLAEVHQAYPDFDTSKIQGYIGQYHNFTGGKAAEQLKAGANAIQHLYQLKAINDAHPLMVHAGVGRYAPAAAKQYDAILNVVTGEMSKFYGMPQTNENREQLRNPLTGINRNSGILGQAAAMGTAFNDLKNQWETARPSASYQAPMPGLNAGALGALKELAPDQYQTFVGSGGNNPAPAPAPAPLPSAGGSSAEKGTGSFNWSSAPVHASGGRQ